MEISIDRAHWLTDFVLPGHENMGIVEEVGAGVTLLKKGDRVVMPFNVADGRCRNCEEGKTAFCTGVNPGFAGGAYGYVAMGPYRGKGEKLLNSRPSINGFSDFPLQEDKLNISASRTPTSTPLSSHLARNTNPISSSWQISSPRDGTASRSAASNPARRSASGVPVPSA